MDFKLQYRRQCLLLGTFPLHVIEANLLESILKFKFYRIPITEWKPVLLTLENDKSLKKLMIEVEVEDPAVTNPSHLHKLKFLDAFLESLCKHLIKNDALVELQLHRLPLSFSNIQMLSKAIELSNSLKHLSLAGCKFGDKGFKCLVEAIKTKPNLVWLDVRGCCLTKNIGEELENLIHFQSVARENAIWKASLRQESPNLDLMGGLRRLSLSENQLSNAVTSLASGLSEDRWIKAVDLQFCQLDNSHVSDLLRATIKKETLVFIDAANNEKLSGDLLIELEKSLKINHSKNSFFNFKSLPSINPSKSAVVSKKIETSNLKNLKPKLTSTPLVKTPKKSSSVSRFSEKKSKATINPSVTFNKDSIVQQRNAKQFKGRCQTANNDRSLHSRDKTVTITKLKKDSHEPDVNQLHEKLDSACSRISELENQIEKLYSATDRERNNASYSSRDLALVDTQTELSVASCLRQLQEILRELRVASSFHEREISHPGQEVQRVIDYLYSILPEMSRKRSIADSHRDHQQTLENSSNLIKARLDVDETDIQDRFPFKENINIEIRKELSYSSNSISRKEQSKSWPVEKITELSPDESLGTISRNSKASGSRGNSQKEEKNAAVPVNNNLNLKTISSHSLAESSLKNLRSNLENVLQQISNQHNIDRDDKLDDFNSQLTLKESLPDLTMNDGDEPTHSNYSLDFDSLSNSFKPLESKPKRNEDVNKMDRKEQPVNRQDPQELIISNISSSSSTLNLSSIVDLLGNFSIGDIGSSTLTPP